MKYKVAICQSNLVPGGRLRVLLGIVDALNGMDLEPDILTSRMTFQLGEIPDIYGKSPRAWFRMLPYLPVHHEFSIILFNILLSRFASDYDLVINTSNSLIFLPKRNKVISYVFYPREGRIRVDTVSIHNPRTLPPYSPERLARIVLRALYRGSELQPGHRIICMTEFTRSALESVYPIPPSTLPVVYPPVEVDAFKQASTSGRGNEFTTVGRFTPDKGQLEQIQLAKQLPDFQFHIVGFVANKKYYEKCRSLVEGQHIKNVHLHPDTSFNEMARILGRSRYFLHTLVNEPFGITAVQAIAAGCLPIVHDSGGQREVVPYPQLRFKTMSEIPALIGDLENQSDASINELRNRLSRHVSSDYNDTVFHEKMTQILRQNLDEKEPPQPSASTSRAAVD
jgi:glycosyltransferase involved in cell wall biosynthesis